MGGAAIVGRDPEGRLTEIESQLFAFKWVLIVLGGLIPVATGIFLWFFNSQLDGIRETSTEAEKIAGNAKEIAEGATETANESLGRLEKKSSELLASLQTYYETAQIGIADSSHEAEEKIATFAKGRELDLDTIIEIQLGDLLQQNAKAFQEEISSLSQVDLANFKNLVSRINENRDSLNQLIRSARLECVIGSSEETRSVCPATYTLMSCTMGRDQGSYTIEHDRRRCVDQAASPGWMAANCCKITFVR